MWDDARPVRPLRALLLVLLLPLATRAADEKAVAPEENSSYVRSDVSAIAEAFTSVDQAATNEDWPAFARAVQAIVDRRTDAEESGAASPYVVPVRGTEVYVGAARAAQGRLLAAGAPALAAAEAQYGPTARALLERARAERREDLLAEVAERFLPIDEGRSACLLLAALASERGDTDRALGWLERLQDVEETSAEDPATLLPWHERRLRFEAVLRARPGREADALASLRAAEAPDAPLSRRVVPLAAAIARGREPATSWPTTGGSADRAALAPPLGAAFTGAWTDALEEEDPLPEVPGHSPADRPSPWVPPRAVVDGGLAFVFDGRVLYALEAETGRIAAEPPPFAVMDAAGRSLTYALDEDAREAFGLAEGHALTLGPAGPGGRLIYLAAPDPESDPSAWGYDQDRDDRLEAVRWDGARLESAWRNGGLSPRDGMPEHTRLYGAPLLYAGRLWMAGIRGGASSSDQGEAWLFGLDPETGVVQVRTFLCSGSPVRSQRPDEALPSAPSGARGRVVVSTGLGVLAAVDVVDGTVEWLLRYDRGVAATNRARRLGALRDGSPRQSSFQDEPPVLALDRVYAAPTDGPYVLVLFDRPRGRERSLVSWRVHRRFDLVDFAAEQVVGILPAADDRPPLLVLVGKGAAAEGEPPPPIAVGLDALSPRRPPVWRAVSTTGHGAEPWGRALLTSKELVVSTADGLVVLDAATGHDLATVDASRTPESWADILSSGAKPFGNLVPIPGVGILAVGSRLVTGWAAR